MLGAPKPFSGNPSCQSTTLHSLLRDKFDSADTIQEKPKRVTLFHYKVPDTNVINMWVSFAQAIKIEHSEGLNVYSLASVDGFGSDDYLVLLHKRSTRRLKGICTVPGFVKRYVGSKTCAGNDIQLTALVKEVLAACDALPSICTLTTQPLNTEEAVDIVAAWRDLSEPMKHFTKLAAIQKKEKDWTPLERAVVKGFSTLQTLTQMSEDDNLKEKVWFVTNELIPKMSSYPNWGSFKYDALLVDCQYFDTDKREFLHCSIKNILCDWKHPASYRNRSIVLKGKAGDGKTYFARSLARMMAASRQTHKAFEERKFIEVTDAEDFKMKGMLRHIEDEVPIIFDDVTPGK